MAVLLSVWETAGWLESRVGASFTAWRCGPLQLMCTPHARPLWTRAPLVLPCPSASAPSALCSAEREARWPAGLVVGRQVRARSLRAAVRGRVALRMSQGGQEDPSAAQSVFGTQSPVGNASAIAPTMSASAPVQPLPLNPLMQRAMQIRLRANATRAAHPTRERDRLEDAVQSERKARYPAAAQSPELGGSSTEDCFSTQRSPEKADATRQGQGDDDDQGQRQALPAEKRIEENPERFSPRDGAEASQAGNAINLSDVHSSSRKGHQERGVRDSSCTNSDAQDGQVADRLQKEAEPARAVPAAAAANPLVEIQREIPQWIRVIPESKTSKQMRLRSRQEDDEDGDGDGDGDRLPDFEDVRRDLLLLKARKP